MTLPEFAAPFVLPRFYPILDTEVAAHSGIDPFSAAQQLIEGGARILQLRHKGFFSREVFITMERIAKLCKEASVIFVVNDRADFARITGAALHLGQEDLTPAAARRVTGDHTVIGYSTHNEYQLREADAEPADYLALGPIFGTASKRNPDPVVGVERLRELRALTRKPLVAIGGITRSNARDVLAAGADSVAIIGDLFDAQGSRPEGLLRSRAEQWIRLTSS